jgi:adenine-specific DNA-methyltransferase
LLARSEEMDDRYSNPDNDPRGVWTSDNCTARNYYSRGTYPVTCPSGRVISGPTAGTYWRFSPEKFQELDKDNRIWWGADGNNVPRLKRFLSEVKAGRIPQTLWTYKEVGHTQEAKKELLANVSFPDADSTFDTPKPVRLLQRVLQIATSPNENAIVLDFFAGSGSMAHATFAQNAEDGGNRRSVSVQIAESLNLPADNNHSLQTIADVCKERIRNAGARIKAETALTASGIDTGLRVLKVDSSNMRDVYYMPDAVLQSDLLGQVDNIRTDRSAEDLLFQVLLDWGIDLALPIASSQIDGKAVFFVDGNSLAACFDEGITDELVKEIAKRKPLRAVFRDTSYGSDSVKINVEQIFRLLSPETEVRSI